MRSLELNLATRPFRNNTLVWTAYVILFGAAVGFTYWNASAFRHYSRELVRMDEQDGNIQTQLADLQRRQQRVDQAIRKSDVKSIGRRTSKANEVIEWKAFSWTRLFNRLEEMLPNKVRMTSVRPIFRDRDRGEDEDEGEGDLRQSISVSVEGIARDLAAFHQIQTELIKHDSFGYVLPRYADRTDNGEYSFAVDFLYYPGEIEAAGDPVEEPQVAATDEPAAPRPPVVEPEQAAEVSDDWAESAEPESADGKTAAEQAPMRKRSLPTVQPEEPDTAAPREPGVSR